MAKCKWRGEQIVLQVQFHTHLSLFVVFVHYLGSILCLASCISCLHIVIKRMFCLESNLPNYETNFICGKIDLCLVVEGA
jgi:hypothetical protein